jgi:hypothetical protein
MDVTHLLAALRIGGWANIAIGVGHLLAMFRLREISAWVGGPSVADPAFHPLFSYVLTVVTALAFIGFGLVALSACGDIRRLPFPTAGVVAIAWVYLLRAVGGTGMGGFMEDTDVKNFCFSLVALAVSVLYGLGARALLVSR